MRAVEYNGKIWDVPYWAKSINMNSKGDVWVTDAVMCKYNSPVVGVVYIETNFEGLYPKIEYLYKAPRIKVLGPVNL